MRCTQSNTQQANCCTQEKCVRVRTCAHICFHMKPLVWTFENILTGLVVIKTSFAKCTFRNREPCDSPGGKIPCLWGVMVAETAFQRATVILLPDNNIRSTSHMLVVCFLLRPPLPLTLVEPKLIWSK